jgi:nucleoid-associated protein YgaU
MRTDVKLGFAIGGVLLAVLIVYVLVVPGGNDRKKISSATNSTGAGAGTSQGGGVTLEPVTPDGKGKAVAPTPPAVPPVAENTPSAKVDPFESAKPETEPRADAKAKNLDWNRLLNETPTLIGETPVAGSGRAGRNPAATEKVAPAPTAGQGTDAAPGGVAGSGVAPGSTGSANPTDNTSKAGETTPLGPTEAPTSTPPTAENGARGAPAGTAQKHTIREGETLSSIAISAYGSANLYPAIMRANPGVDPARLKPGMTINVPPLADVKPSEAAAVGAAAKVAPMVDGAKEYRVQPGDSLHKISMRLYGKINRADKIYQLNKQAIGDDPHRLKVGQVLQLPEPPAAAAASR